MQILIERGNGQLDKLQHASASRAIRQLMHSAKRAHRAACKWAIVRLRAELLRRNVHRLIGEHVREELAPDQAVVPMQIGKAFALLKSRRQMAPPASGTDSEGASPSPPSPGPSSAADEEGRDSDPPETVTHWQRHYPYNWATPMALDSRGEKIYYRVESDNDRMWAWRLMRAVDHHRDVREQDLEKLKDMHAKELQELHERYSARPSARQIFFGY